MSQQPETFASETGQVMTGAEWLDVHFEGSRREYEAQLRAVSIQPGWHVLDAATGSGSFLPWMADLVGAGGRLTALDLAPDNVELVGQRVADWDLPCPVKVTQGTVLDLPYPDNAFDAVWFANTSQYLTNDELFTTLAEFRRVVRPGGLVAIKETDITMYRLVPAPRGLLLRWFEASARGGSTQSAGVLRAGELPGWLRRTGLLDVWQKSTLIEHTPPLSPPTRANWRDLILYLANVAPELDLPPADHEAWKSFSIAANVERFLDNPDCWLIDCNILTVGTVPLI